MFKKAFIYLARQGNSELYKIGSSDNPEERIKQLQTANGEQLELIETFETNYKFKLETALHRRFLPSKTLGEWFILKEEDIKNFKSICAGHEEIFNLLREKNTYVQDREKKNKQW